MLAFTRLEECALTVLLAIGMHLPRHEYIVIKRMGRLMQLAEQKNAFITA